MPNYEAVTSSNIDSVAHENGDLYVKFKNGSEYKYPNVPFELYEQLRDAPSVGQFLNSSIKGSYSFERIV